MVALDDFLNILEGDEYWSVVIVEVMLIDQKIYHIYFIYTK